MPIKKSLVAFFLLFCSSHTKAMEAQKKSYATPTVTLCNSQNNQESSTNLIARPENLNIEANKATILASTVLPLIQQHLPLFYTKVGIVKHLNDAPFSPLSLSLFLNEKLTEFYSSLRLTTLNKKPAFRPQTDPKKIELLEEKRKALQTNKINEVKKRLLEVILTPTYPNALMILKKTKCPKKNLDFSLNNEITPYKVL